MDKATKREYLGRLNNFYTEQLQMIGYAYETISDFMCGKKVFYFDLEDDNRPWYDDSTQVVRLEKYQDGTVIIFNENEHSVFLDTIPDGTKLLGIAEYLCRL